MFFKIVHELLSAVHYLLLGAYTGAVMNLISCFRNGLFSVCVAKGKKTAALIVIFSVVFVFLGAMVWEGPKSIFVIAAKVLTCIAYGCRDTATVRKLSLLSNSGWLIYNLIIFSVAGFVCDSLMLTSVIVGIIRHDLPAFLEKRRAKKELGKTEK